MCYKTECRTCEKTTWGGCGHHIESVMGNVPEAQQCKCAPAERKTGLTGASLFKMLFGRSQ